MGKYIEETGIRQLITRFKSYFVTNAGAETTTTIGIDTVPTSGSSNLITSGAVYNVVGNINTVLDQINGEVI